MWRPPVAGQSAWRVQVAASRGRSAGRTRTWDSGKVAGSIRSKPPMPDRPWRRATAGSGACACGTRPADPAPGARPPRSRWACCRPSTGAKAAWIGRRLAPPKGWADQVLTVDFTLKGRFFDVLFRARPEGKTYGEAYVLRVGEVDGAPSLMLQVRQYPGGSNPGVKLKRLQVWPLPPTLVPLAGPRRRLTIEAKGPRYASPWTAYWSGRWTTRPRGRGPSASWPPRPRRRRSTPSICVRRTGPGFVSTFDGRRQPLHRRRRRRPGPGDRGRRAGQGHRRAPGPSRAPAAPGVRRERHGRPRAALHGGRRLGGAERERPAGRRPAPWPPAGPPTTSACSTRPTTSPAC
jgi:hypothetical protein